MFVYLACYTSNDRPHGDGTYALTSLHNTNCFVYVPVKYNKSFDRCTSRKDCFRLGISNRSRQTIAICCLQDKSLIGLN